MKNWTEDKYYRLWYLYDAVLNGISYEHFSLEINNIGVNVFHLNNIYQDILNKDMNKEAFICEILDNNAKRSRLLDDLAFKFKHQTTEPEAEPDPFENEERF